jgi:hypothetical protein
MYVFEKLFLGLNSNIHEWDLFRAQITKRYEFLIFGASPIGRRAWEKEILNRSYLRPWLWDRGPSSNLYQSTTFFKTFDMMYSIGILFHPTPMTYDLETLKLASHQSIRRHTYMILELLHLVIDEGFSLFTGNLQAFLQRLLGLLDKLVLLLISLLRCILDFGATRCVLGDLLRF